MNCKFNGCTDYAGHEGAHQMARANPKKSRCRLCGELPQTAAQRRTAKAAGYRPCPSCSNLSVGSRKSSAGAKRFLRERSQKTETAQKKSAPSAYRNKTGRVSGSVFVPDLPLRPLRLSSSLKGVHIGAMVSGTPAAPKAITDLTVVIRSNRMKIKVLGYAKVQKPKAPPRKSRRDEVEEFDRRGSVAVPYGWASRKKVSGGYLVHLSIRISNGDFWILPDGDHSRRRPRPMTREAATKAVERYLARNVKRKRNPGFELDDEIDLATPEPTQPRRAVKQKAQPTEGRCLWCGSTAKPYRDEYGWLTCPDCSTVGSWRTMRQAWST